MALFAKLDASYYLDPKVLDLADERAELLFVRAICHSITHLTDGFIHRRAIGSFAPFTDDIAPAELAAVLVDAGLWEQVDKGWQIVAFAKRNRTSDEVLTPDKGRFLAHKRHHVDKGRPNPECEFCQDAKPQVDADECGTHATRQSEAQCGPAMPDPEPEPDPSTSISGQPQVLASAASLDVEQQTNRAVGVWARLVAEAAGAASPDAYAATVGRAITDDQRASLRSLVASGMAPDEAAARLANETPAAVAIPTTDETAEARDRARRAEEATQRRLAEVAVAEVGDGKAGAAMARANLRPVPEAS